MTIQSALADSAAYVSSRLEQEILLGFAIDKPREFIIAHPEYAIGDAQENTFVKLCRARASRIPVAYLTNRKEFFGRSFYINEHVLIPRPETEILSENVIALMPTNQPYSLCDVGTGSGCIGVTLAKENPNLHVTAVDISPQALAVARTNACAHLVESRMQFVESDLLTAVREQHFDCIVANLPYVSEQQWLLAQPEIRFCEPKIALTPGPTGLEGYDKLFDQLVAFKNVPRYLIYEIGFDQKEPMEQLVRQKFLYCNIEVAFKKDLAGIDRVCIVTFL